jgi:hypothetical protein
MNPMGIVTSFVYNVPSQKEVMHSKGNCPRGARSWT